MGTCGSGFDCRYPSGRVPTHFMRLIQAGVVTKSEGVSCFVEEDKVVGDECLDNLLARRVSVAVYFLG